MLRALLLVVVVSTYKHNRKLQNALHQDGIDAEILQARPAGQRLSMDFAAYEVRYKFTQHHVILHALVQYLAAILRLMC